MFLGMIMLILIAPSVVKYSSTEMVYSSSRTTSWLVRDKIRGDIEASKWRRQNQLRVRA